MNNLFEKILFYLPAALAVGIFVGIIVLLVYYQKINQTYTKRVLMALIIGIIFGAVLKLVTNNSILGIDEAYMGNNILPWINLVASGFVNLLRVIVIPLIFIMILATFVNLDNSKKMAKWVSKTITILIITTVIAAIVGILISVVFDLNASSIIPDDKTIARGEKLETIAEGLQEQTFADMLLDFIPKNIFTDLSQSRSTSTIAVVIFAAILGYGVLVFCKKNPDKEQNVKNVINSIRSIIIEMVQFVISLTPYGVVALLTKMMINTDFEAVKQLAIFFVASYVAMAILYVIHMLIISMFGMSPLKYTKKVWETLMFAFVSRSSAATMPKTQNVQEQSFGVEPGLASLTTSLGASMGQNA